MSAGQRPAGRRASKRPAAGVQVSTADPFTVLGVDPQADLTDDDIRSAWRRVAAATHPDRPDGGDPARFAAAAAAYTELRTTFGRREAAAAAGQAAAAGARAAWLGTLAGAASGKVSARGLARLGLRVLGAAIVAVLVLLAARPGPAGPALVTGVVTWLILTARRDLR